MIGYSLYIGTELPEPDKQKANAMSLLDAARKATGESTPNYLKHGRHVVLVKRVSFREADALKSGPGANAGFAIDGELLHSTREDFNNGGFYQGDTVRANDAMKVPNQGLARVRKALAAMKSVKEQRKIGELDFGIEGCTDQQFKDEWKRLCGETQPLVGVPITIIATESKSQKTGGTYTLYEVVVPHVSDLEKAGLLKKSE